jgi:hypothetical protein
LFKETFWEGKDRLEHNVLVFMNIILKNTSIFNL